MEKKKGILTIVITNNCNLNCIYCYETRKTNSSINIDTAQFHITNYLNSSIYDHIMISLFGGEPFLYFDKIKEIIEWTWSQEWKNTYEIHLSTNGTILTDSIKEWLNKNKNRLHLALSIDGTKESHDKNRSNSYDKIDKDFFLRTFKNQAVKMTISEESLLHLAKDVIHIHELGFIVQECNLAEGIDWSKLDNVEILKVELEKLYNYYIEHHDIKPALIIDMDIFACENPKKYMKWCSAGEELTTIDVDGTTYPCHYLTPMSFPKNELEYLLKIDYSDVKGLVDMECYEHCYLYACCSTCYVAEYTLSGKINKRSLTTCGLMKIRALYTAKLLAHKIANDKLFETKSYDKIKLLRTIRAIKKINYLYSDMLTLTD